MQKVRPETYKYHIQAIETLLRSEPNACDALVQLIYQAEQNRKNPAELSQSKDNTPTLTDFEEFIKSSPNITNESVAGKVVAHLESLDRIFRAILSKSPEISIPEFQKISSYLSSRLRESTSRSEPSKQANPEVDPTFDDIINLLREHIMYSHSDVSLSTSLLDREYSKYLKISEENKKNSKTFATSKVLFEDEKKHFDTLHALHSDMIEEVNNNNNNTFKVDKSQICIPGHEPYHKDTSLVELHSNMQNCLKRMEKFKEQSKTQNLFLKFWRAITRQSMSTASYQKKIALVREKTHKAINPPGHR